MIKPFLGSTPGLKERQETLDGQAVLIREASLLERAEFQRIGHEVGQPEAIAYYIERRILWPNGEPIYTRAEALTLAQTPPQQAEQLFAITHLLLGEKKSQPIPTAEEQSSAPANGSGIASH